MFDETAIRAAVEERQQLRKGAGLPLLDIESEVKALREQAAQENDTRAFEEWKTHNPHIVLTVKAHVLQELRAEWNKPDDWYPSGVLSGGGMWFAITVRERLRAAYENAKMS